MNLPTISIVTPSFNQGEFIEETIKSVLDQDYPKIEFIIIDGASSDNTVDIIQKYNNKIKFWISEKDKGQTHAINKGLKYVTGDIWAYLCSDDTFNSGVFQKVADYFKKNPNVDAVYGNCNWTDKNSNFLAKKVPMNPFNRNKLLLDNFIYQPSVFLRKKVLESFKSFDESLDYGMDYEYWLRISEKFKIEYVNLNVSNYRLHFESKSIKHVKAMRKEMIIIKEPYGFGKHAKLEYKKFIMFGFFLYRIKQFLYRAKSKMLKK